MSEGARTEMARVNAARFTTQMPRNLGDVPAPPQSDGSQSGQPATAPSPEGAAATEASVGDGVRFDAG
ncbi:MAG TPA: hypothetical protein VM915_15040, partial [Verrucomicrobiae bacterium]|nr:hypothetical protein [Verrucomicrobiae bacterium]